MGSKDSEWRELYYNQRELLEKALEMGENRGQMLARIWLGIDACVDDPDLANTLRLLIIGDFIPDLVFMAPLDSEPQDPEAGDQ